MDKKTIGIGSVIAILTLITLIWNFKDNFVFADDFNQFKQQVEQLNTSQMSLNQKLENHLTIERINLINDLEEKLEKLYAEPNQNDPAVRAKIKKTSTQLEVLYGQQ